MDTLDNWAGEEMTRPFSRALLKAEAACNSYDSQSGTEMNFRTAENKKTSKIIYIM